MRCRTVCGTVVVLSCECPLLVLGAGVCACVRVRDGVKEARCARGRVSVEWFSRRWRQLSAHHTSAAVSGVPGWMW